MFGLAFLAPPALVMAAFAAAAGPGAVLSSWLVTSWRQWVGEHLLDVGHAWGIRLASWAVLVLGGAASAAAFLRPGRPPTEAGARLTARAASACSSPPPSPHRAYR